MADNHFRTYYLYINTIRFIKFFIILLPDENDVHDYYPIFNDFSGYKRLLIRFCNST